MNITLINIYHICADKILSIKNEAKIFSSATKNGFGIFTFGFFGAGTGFTEIS